MTLTIDFEINEDNLFDVYVSDNLGGTGVNIQGKTIEETMSQLNNHIGYYLNNVYFKVNGVEVLSRLDFESLSMPLNTEKISNATMQQIANEVFYTLKLNYGITDTMKYFKQDEDISDKLWDKINEEYFDLIEKIGVNYGMTY